jgi:hypothetical protein
MTNEFKKQNTQVLLIIDCTELKIEMPSSLVPKSQTYFDYKSANSFKGLLGVGCRGGIMFVSHLYTGSISDKEICQRSGLFDLLKTKKENGELVEGDAIMADKGFTVTHELQETGLKPEKSTNSREKKEIRDSRRAGYTSKCSPSCPCRASY